MTRTFSASGDSIGEMLYFLTTTLQRRNFNPRLVYEYRLLVEEIVGKLIECAPPNAELSIRIYRRHGNNYVKLTCPGQPVILQGESEDDLSGKIIDMFRDYLTQAYGNNCNSIIFSAFSSSNRSLIRSVISAVLALAVSYLLCRFCSPEQYTWLIDNIAAPFMTIFIKCIQTVALPTTFFSLIANLISVQANIDHNHSIIRIINRYVATSLASFLIGFFSWKHFVSVDFLENISNLQETRENFMGQTLREVLVNAVPGNIIEPFIISNPLPLLVMAVLVGLAAGRYFGPDGLRIKNGLSSISGLFDVMLDLVYNWIPYFLFFAQLIRYKTYGISFRGSAVYTLLPFLLPMCAMFLLYIVMMCSAGISPVRFFREYGEVVWENLKIGSNLQAYPYNKRILARKTSLSRSFLGDALNLATLINMDGNCLFISTYALLMISYIGQTVSISQYIGLTCIVVLLSAGAPNQPGSFLISSLVLMSYLGISSTLCFDALIVEALLGKMYSFFNSMGDIEAIITENERLLRRKKKEESIAS